MWCFLLLSACTPGPSSGGGDCAVLDNAESADTAGSDSGDSGEGDSGTHTGVVVTDDDGDGFRAEEDCDDGDITIHPGAPESCDGEDEDCDGLIDDGCASALVGDLGVEAAQVVIVGPDVNLGFGSSVHVGDIDADGLADVVAPVVGVPSADVLAFTGPFPPVVESDIRSDTVLGMPEIDVDAFLLTTDLAVAGGADRVGLVASIFTAREQYVGALYYSELRPGLRRDDADLDLRWQRPRDDAMELWSLGFAGFVPEPDGGAVVYTAAWYVTYDSCKYGAWVADASTPGVVETTDVARLGATAAVGGWCWPLAPRDAGDLDGDGAHELLLADGQLMDVYFGPLSSDAEGREADARLGGTWPDDDDYTGAWGAFDYHSADIDNDGRDELMTTMAVGDRGDPTCDLVRTVMEAGLPQFDMDAPLLVGGDCSDSGFGAEIVTLDLDGDGHMDVAVSDHVESSVADRAGVVYVEYGPFEGIREVGGEGSGRVLGALEGETLGTALAAGDTNADVFDDLVVGSNRGNWEDNPGTIWIFLGGSR